MDNVKTRIVVDTEDTDVEDGTYSCNGCDIMMSGSAGTVWYRCTDCIDIDICQNCHMKDFHSHHKRHISRFTCPAAEQMDDGYCDACGVLFDWNKYNVRIGYQCNLCEDYCLCARCKSKLMHINHSKYLKPILNMEKEICE